MPRKLTERNPWPIWMLATGVLALLPLASGVQGADEKGAKAPATKPEPPKSDAKPADKSAEKPAEKPLGLDAAGLFTRLDANADGQVTLPEAGSENATLFNRLLRIADKNTDAKLSKAEFVAGLNQTETPASMGMSMRGGPPMGPGGFMPDADMAFRRLDANRDGKVTADEAPEERKAMLSMAVGRFDKNGDKALSAEEFKAMFEERGGKGPPPKKGDAKKGDGKKKDKK